jgi:hypothetical protein
MSSLESFSRRDRPLPLIWRVVNARTGYPDDDEPRPTPCAKSSVSECMDAANAVADGDFLVLWQMVLAERRLSPPLLDWKIPFETAHLHSAEEPVHLLQCGQGASQRSQGVGVCLDEQPQRCPSHGSPMYPAYPIVFDLA